MDFGGADFEWIAPCFLSRKLVGGLEHLPFYDDNDYTFGDIDCYLEAEEE